MSANRRFANPARRRSPAFSRIMPDGCFCKSRPREKSDAKRWLADIWAAEAARRSVLLLQTSHSADRPAYTLPPAERQERAPYAASHSQRMRLMLRRARSRIRLAFAFGGFLGFCLRAPARKDSGPWISWILTRGLCAFRQRCKGGLLLRHPGADASKSRMPVFFALKIDGRLRLFGKSFDCLYQLLFAVKIRFGVDMLDIGPDGGFGKMELSRHCLCAVTLRVPPCNLPLPIAELVHLAETFESIICRLRTRCGIAHGLFCCDCLGLPGLSRGVVAREPIRPPGGAKYGYRHTKRCDSHCDAEYGLQRIVARAW